MSLRFVAARKGKKKRRDICISKKTAICLELKKYHAQDK